MHVSVPATPRTAARFSEVFLLVSLAECWNTAAGYYPETGIIQWLHIRISSCSRSMLCKASLNSFRLKFSTSGCSWRTQLGGRGLEPHTFAVHSCCTEKIVHLNTFACSGWKFFVPYLLQRSVAHWWSQGNSVGPGFSEGRQGSCVLKPRKIQNLSKNCGSADPLKNSSDLQDGLKTLIGAEYSGGSECYRASFRNGFSSVPSRQLGCINFFFLTPLQSDSNLNEIWGPKGLRRVSFCNNRLV